MAVHAVLSSQLNSASSLTARPTHARAELTASPFAGRVPRPLPHRIVTGSELVTVGDAGLRKGTERPDLIGARKAAMASGASQKLMVRRFQRPVVLVDRAPATGTGLVVRSL